MAAKPLPDIDTLHQLLRYEPETGKLFWKERDDVRPEWNTRWAGKEAFATTRANGYKRGCIVKRRLYAHRVIMAMVNGEWPPEEVDHINGVKDDNRLCNLRLVTKSENMRNMRRPSRNTSGCIGVYWDKGTQKWVAQIRADGRKKCLGYFARKADAIAARKDAEAELGFHENHGR